MQRLFLPLFLTLVGMTSHCTAATFTTDFERETQRPVIHITGEITQSDGDQFSVIAHRYQNALVSFNSRGGSLLSGIQIGTVIRLRAFSTLVRGGNLCASACAYAWLAGVQRYAEGTSKIGFHSAYVIERGIAKETGVGNALLGSYLARIALTDDAIIYFTSAQPEEMNWLNSSVAQKLKLSIQDYSTQSIPQRDLVQAASNSQNSLDSAAKSFIRKLFSFWSADNDSAVSFLMTSLSHTVDFYGKPISKESIIKEKMTALKRWPIRVYAERPSSLKVSCIQQTKICTISGVLDWDARNPEKGRSSVGVAEFEYRLDMTNSDPKIISESSTVIERR